jgi:DNA-binding GntR family transcriptional regulator
MFSVAIVFDLGQTCHDESFARTVYTANRNPVIERIVTTVSPIDLATIADVCDVDDFMEERPLFPATRSGSLAI